MAGQPGFFDRDERYALLSSAGDPLGRLAMVVDFELFRPALEAALERSDRAMGGRPPYEAVLMFKVLVLQTLYTLSDDQTEYQLKDRLSFMRFVGLALEDRAPDAKTLWLFREQLTQTGRRASVRPVRSRPARGRLSRHGRADRRCHRDPGAPAAAHEE
jgi:transposase, IS5 family